MRGVLANGARIRAERIARGLTQEQLAVSADVDVKTIRKAEQGRRLDVGTLTSLSRALGVELPSLMSAASAAGDINRIRVQVVEQWVAAWDDQDIDALMALFHDDAVMLLPGGPGIPFGGRFDGKAAIRRANKLVWQIVSTRPVNSGDYSLVVGDDTVVMHGTKHIQLPDNRQVPLSSVHIYRFIDDLIGELRVEYDTLTLRGLLPAAAEGPPPR